MKSERFGMKRKTRLNVLLGHAPDDDQLDRKLMAARCDGTREDFASDFLSVRSSKPRCFDSSHWQLAAKIEWLKRQVNRLRRQNSRLKRKLRPAGVRSERKTATKSQFDRVWNSPKRKYIGGILGPSTLDKI